MVSYFGGVVALAVILQKLCIIGLSAVSLRPAYSASL